jgi:hypothetical protein
MRLTLSICIGIALATASPVRALADGAPVTADTLASLQSLVDYCAHSNPEDAAHYRESSADYLKNAPAQTVDELRASPAYKDAYATATAQLAKYPATQITTICESLLRAPDATRQGARKSEEPPADAPTPKE